MILILKFHIFIMFFTSIFKWDSWMSTSNCIWRNVLTHNRARLNYRSIANFNPPKNDHIITKPNAFSNFNIFVNKCIIIRNSIAFIIME